MTPEESAQLRAAFPPEAIGKLPKAGRMLDYVGHANVTDRLLEVDPEWTWKPAAVNEFGVPLITAGGLWIKLTVCGVTRYGWGDGPDIKQMISDAIRNAGMRFGVGLSLWSKEELESESVAQHLPPASGVASAGAVPPPAPAISEEKVPKHKREALKARCSALQAEGVSVADAREAVGLPLVDSCNPDQFKIFDALIADLETALEAPFTDAQEVQV